VNVLFIIFTEEAVNLMPAPENGDATAEVRRWLVNWLKSDDVVYDKADQEVGIEECADAVMAHPKNNKGNKFWFVEDELFCIKDYPNLCTVIREVMQSKDWSYFRNR
jgi:hypothetical protein